MSVLFLPAETIANAPDFVSRLRVGRFTSPSGAESFFFFDELTRTRSKRGVAHEIVDTDNTIIQDLGSSLQVFNMAVYFVGPNCDLEADGFYNSLYERYTPDKPGMLVHPRWGNVPVIPFGEPEQTESYVSGAGISRVNVVFRETKTLAFANTAKLSSATVAANASKVNASALDRATRMVGNTKASYARFKNSITSKIKTVTDAIDSVQDLAEDVADEVDSITQDLYSALDTAATPVTVLAQLSSLVQTVASVPSTVTGIVNAYVDMANDIIGQYSNEQSGAATNEEKNNLALSSQVIAASALSGVAIASLSVDYSVRDQVGESIDSLSALAESYNAMIDAAAQGSSFAPDSDVSTGIHGVIFDTQSLLINKAFSLKSRRTYVLDQVSDCMTETWTHYGDLSQLQFFIDTNKIIGNEFIELPAGRTIAVYV